ncbi:MAG: SMP-30/gluconolactonase/LRE family protein, partial [Actinobacteria bacterium]|nr:SMP-30/gluconolactonase/LRE family protein [Actinomycetota bacterium]
KFALDGTPGTPSRFGGPGPFLEPGKFVSGARGVTVDGDGNVWVGDMPNFRAQKFSPSGAFLLAAPNPAQPPPDGGFRMPGGVALDAAGNIFVADTFNWRVQRFAPSGAFSLKWGHRGGGTDGFNYARGIAVDQANGDVLVGDTDNQAVKRFTNDGKLRWATPGVKVFALDVAPDGRTFAADFQTNNVKVLSPGGALVSTFATGQLANPRGIDVDPDGSIWVSSRGHGVVKHFSATGALLGQLGTGQLVSPADVESDATNVYVADQGANQIKVFTKANGTYVGSFGSGGSTLGRMLGPQGLHLTPAGRLYVLEMTGERVQEFQVRS